MVEKWWKWHHRTIKDQKNQLVNFNAIAYLFDQKEENNEKTTNELIAFHNKMGIQSEIKNGISLPTIYSSFSCSSFSFIFD